MSGRGLPQPPERIALGFLGGLRGLPVGPLLHLLRVAPEERKMDVTARILFDVGQQCGEILAGPVERIVKFGIVHQLAHRALALRDAGHQIVEMPDGLRKFDGELLFGELRDDPVYIADDAVHALGVVAEHVGELRKVLQRAFQVVFLGGKYLRHVARHGVEVAERPGDIAGVVLHQPVEVVERTRQIAGELRDFLLEEIQLQRAKTAREAIATIAELANTYGYASSGESFSIVDRDEAWIMELIGKGYKADGKGGNANKGIVWVARRIPDGYVSAHANQARITTFPKNDPENCLYAPDVVSFAREMGYYDGPDADFSFCDAYAPLDFGALRACEARVWAFFRTVADDMDRYADYAMGHNAANRMPLWVMPREKVSPKTVFDCMRDHYEGTPMDMTADIGAGGSACPYRWRPMEFEVDGVSYVNERATATQQTGFWFVAQARPWNPADMGILWFGVDDAATSCLTPIYCSAQEVPACLSEQNGSMLEYSPTAAFWLFNRVTNFAYMRYDMISADIRKVVDKWENGMLETVREVDAEALSLSPKARGKFLTAFSTATAQQLFDRWSKLDKYLLVKYMDGNVKSEKADVLTFLDGDGGPAHFVDNGNGRNIPDKIQFPGYNEKWKRAVAKDNGEILRVVK